MPETPMHKNRLAPARENDIRPAGKVAPMQSVPESLTVKITANNQFRRRIPIFDRAHGPAARDRVVRHDLLIAVASDRRRTSPARSIVVVRTVSTPLCVTSNVTLFISSSAPPKHW